MAGNVLARRLGNQCPSVDELIELHQAILKRDGLGKRPDEVCENCSKVLPAGETVAVWGQQIVCYHCYKQFFRAVGAEARVKDT